MRQLILHIGSHKTGTTALQQWLGRNADMLALQGIGYLQAGGEPHAHRLLVMTDETRPFSAGYRLRNATEFARNLEDLPGDRVVVSSENFSFFLDDAAVAELASTVKQLFDDVVVMVYLRRQDRHAVSHFMEGARAERPPEWELWGHGLKALPEPNDFQPLYLNYFNRLKIWGRHFGEEALRVRIFDRKVLVGGDIASDFADALGFDTSGFIKSRDTNTSLDRVKVRMGHLANVITQNNLLTRTLLVSTRNTDQVLRPSRTEAKAFLAPYLESNAQLNDWLKVTAHPALFDDDFDDLPEAPQKTWTDEEFNRALKSSISTLTRLTQEENFIDFADLRAAAQALGPVAPQRALRMVRAALLQRPNSKVMWAMEAELLAHVKSGRQSPLTDYSAIEED